jgi:hypothetical protein
VVAGIEAGESDLLSTLTISPSRPQLDYDWIEFAAPFVIRSRLGTRLVRSPPVSSGMPLAILKAVHDREGKTAYTLLFLRLKVNPSRSWAVSPENWGMDLLCEMAPG